MLKNFEPLYLQIGSAPQLKSRFAFAERLFSLQEKPPELLSVFRISFLPKRH